jgi:hypothetical protein
MKITFTKESEITRVLYIDDDNIKINNPSLVIRVDRINALGYSLIDFVIKYNLTGFTNGKLFIIQLMEESALGLKDIMILICGKTGLKDRKDLVLLGGEGLQQTEEIEPMIDYNIGDVKYLQWLDTAATSKGLLIQFLKRRRKFQLRWGMNKLSQ